MARHPAELIASAVAATIAAATLSQTVDVERVYRPRKRNREELSGQPIAVWVAATSHSADNFDRGTSLHTVAIQIAVLQALTGDAPADVDPLVGLTQEICDALPGSLTLAEGDKAKQMTLQTIELPDSDALRDLIFLGVVEMEWVVRR
ncbi:MAG: hypothetical protein NT069_33165 [Planctomycetota bacterium]|nr:hypothetical protein [Planctomycetota bacterium]